MSPVPPHPFRTLASVLLLALLVPGGLTPAAFGQEDSTSASRPVTDLALRDVVGVIATTEIHMRPGGDRWVEAVLRIEGEPDLRLTLGPAQMLEHAGFLLASGDSVRVRYFVGGESPPGVERIRNLHTGRTLRLRCLRGKPVWDPHHPGVDGGYRGGATTRRVGGPGSGGR